MCEPVPCTYSHVLTTPTRVKKSLPLRGPHDSLAPNASVSLSRRIRRLGVLQIYSNLSHVGGRQLVQALARTKVDHDGEETDETDWKSVVGQHMTRIRRRLSCAERSALVPRPRSPHSMPIRSAHDAPKIPSDPGVATIGRRRGHLEALRGRRRGGRGQGVCVGGGGVTPPLQPVSGLQVPEESSAAVAAARRARETLRD